MGPNGPLLNLTQFLGLGVLPFTFWGLVVGLVFYSMPFVVQLVQNAFEAIGNRPLEVAAMLCAGPAGHLFQRRCATGLRRLCWRRAVGARQRCALESPCANPHSGARCQSGVGAAH